MAESFFLVFSGSLSWGQDLGRMREGQLQGFAEGTLLLPFLFTDRLSVIIDKRRKIHVRLTEARCYFILSRVVSLSSQ